ncbi:MAG: type I 3-dehydroquinate dehydratase [bacterium]|nr:type I 3-dehydroquinate dehydratase [bacterium]
MICISIGQPTVKRCEAFLTRIEVSAAEIRLDGANFSPDQVDHVFSLHPQLIATCRPGPGRGEEERGKILERAITAGAAYVDIEIESGADFKQEIIKTARRHLRKVIISCHNYEKTPAKAELEQVLNRCFSEGADIAKIACLVHSEADSARILSLYDYDLSDAPGESPNRRQILALGMGEKGKITRVAAPLLGAPFTFAATSAGKETAAGQLDLETLGLIYEMLET